MIVSKKYTERIPRSISKSKPVICGFDVSFIYVVTPMAFVVGMATTGLRFMSAIKSDVKLRYDVSELTSKFSICLIRLRSFLVITRLTTNPLMSKLTPPVE